MNTDLTHLDLTRITMYTSLKKFRLIIALSTVLSVLCSSHAVAEETPISTVANSASDTGSSIKKEDFSLSSNVPLKFVDPLQDTASNSQPDAQLPFTPACFQSSSDCHLTVLSARQLPSSSWSLEAWDEAERAFNTLVTTLPVPSTQTAESTVDPFVAKQQDGPGPSYSALDLGGGLVGDFRVAYRKLIAEEPTPPKTPTAPVPPPRSHALNLWSLRSLRKPVGQKVLDTGVAISGPAIRDTKERWWTRDYMSGNWNGIRDLIYEKYGVEFTLAPFIDVFGNISGGRSRNSAYSSTSTISFDFYTDAVAWKGGQVHWTNAWIDGGSASVGRTYAGTLNSVYFGDPPRKGLRLFELWYGQKVLDDQLDVRLGKIYPFVKLGISQVATVFQNSNFGYPAFIGTNASFGYSTVYGAAPFSTEILFSPKNSPWFFQSVIMDGFDDPTAGPLASNKNQNVRGLDLAALNGKEGAEGIIELGYKLNQHKGETGLPGTYRAGFQWHAGEFQSVTTDANGGIRRSPFTATRGTKRGNYAFYAVAEQMLFRESSDPKDRTQGLSGFIKGTFVPLGDRNTISYNAAAGLVYEGPFPGRNRDLIGFGVAHTQLSTGLQDVARNSIGFDPSVTKIPGGETALEVMYAAELAPWWLIIFSAQHIINPSFNTFQSTPNATVIGISTRFGL